ncbi:TPA: phage tail protein [Escherichia coli]
MFHVDNSTGVPVMPQPSPVTSETELFFTEGGNGVPPTYPGPDWFNVIQSELLNILKAAGIDPDKMDNTQILVALKKLFLSRSNPFGDIKADGAAAIAAALSTLGLGEGAPAIGVPFFWPSAAMPNTVIDSWSSMVFLKFNGAKFSATDYPVLAKVFPALALPDARGDFIRIWDDGRGIDVGRTLLSGQSHTIMDHAHNMELWTGDGLAAGSAREGVNPGILATYGDGGIVKTDEPGLKVPSSLRALSSRSVKRYGEISGNVDTETRPRNIAFNFLVRAK